MEFRVLGPFQVLEQSRELTPTAPKPREVLALLALRRNQLVQTYALIEDLWGANPPASATSTLQTYIYKLRKLLNDDLVPESESMLATRPAGYIMSLPASDIDVARFENLVNQGRAILDSGDCARGAQVLSEALALWRGPALADIEPGELLAAHITSLEESRLSALELRIEADLDLGRHRELISELTELCAAHQLHEAFHCHLMLALYRSGRRCDALEVYRNLRKVTIDELGLEPSASAHRLHQSMLASDPELDAPAVRQHVTSSQPIAPLPVPVAAPLPAQSEAAAPLLLVPAQVPPDIADFVGREEWSRQVEAVLLPGEQRNAAPLAVLTGMPGIGKSALAVHAAHRVAPRFPDGQLYADLGGSSGDLADTAEVLEGFLRAVGVPADQVPGQCAERAKLFRTSTAGRRMLIVLDNAACVGQIRFLLPAYAGCAVIVTSRSRLSELPGAEILELDPLSMEQGIELLANIVGADRVTGERPAAAAIVRLCGYLPLALRSIGTRLAATRVCPLGKVARYLEDDRSRLAALDFAGFDVCSRLEPSYESLSGSERCLFRFLGLLNEPEFTAQRVAEFMGCDRFAVDELLLPLLEHNLVLVRRCPESGEVFYGFHNLVRLYARKCLEEMLADSQQKTIKDGSIVLPAASVMMDHANDSGQFAVWPATMDAEAR